MTNPWNILIVDDERDVHMVTTLAVKRKVWRARPFKLTSAYSAKDARELLSSPDAPSFHVALVDVVMETEHAGLELCEWLRENVPLSLRIILRTGQPGVAPEDFVLNEYDIDQYLAKTEATAERLYSAMRTSLRSSQDIMVLLRLGSQLQKFTTALQAPTTTINDLLKIMIENVGYLREKHEIGEMIFVPDAQQVLQGEVPPALAESSEDANLVEISKALLAAHQDARATPSIRPGDGYGLREKSYLFPVRALETPARMTEEQTKKWTSKLGSFFKSMVGVESPIERPKNVEGGFYIVCPEVLSPKALAYLQRDIGLFAENWKIAFALHHLQDVVVQERLAAIQASERIDTAAG